MKVYLRVPANAREAVIPVPISARMIAANPHPVPPRGRPGSAVYTTVIKSHAASNRGRYVPPRARQVWIYIPDTVLNPCNGC
jgi:hypothetical protein